MRHSRFQSQRGSVLLVALCFVTVLGISLASYIAVCSRAMQISNRTYQAGLSRQLAEAGLEEALRAFNKNDWSDWTNGVTADWTVSGTTATCTLTFPNGQFGQGATGSVKIRIDNYNANQLNSTWTSTANYRIGNLVNYGGVWYRATANGSNKTPSASTIYWTPEQTPIQHFWISGTAYVTGNMVSHNNAWYRCTSGHTSSTSNQPPNASYWLSIPTYTMDADLQYSNESLLNYYGTWYRWLSATGWDSAPPITWRWRIPQSYAVGDVVCYNAIWYRCILAHTSSASIYPTNASYWSSAATLAAAAAASYNWSSSHNYNLGDVVYRSGAWYRCILAHINQGPPNATYWSTAPLLPNTWESNRQYSQNDTVSHNGVWYLSLQNSNYGQNPATATSYWASSANTSYQWNSTSAYSIGSYRSYGGVWYRCVAGNTGQSPNNTTYWTASWAQASGVTTGAPVIYAEGTINLAGSGSTKTQLRATIAPAPLFPNAVASTSTLTITTGTGTVDSYDNSLGTTYASQIGNTSTNYSAVLAAASTLSITGTTAVKGYLAWPSPPAGISTDSTIYGPSSPLTPKMDTSRVSRSPFIPQFSTLPGPSLASAFGSANFLQGTQITSSYGSTISIGTAGATTPAVYYFNGSLDIGTNSGYDLTAINIVGPIKLYVNGNLRIRTGGAINITSTGSAEIHCTGYIRTYSGSPGFQNSTLDSKKLILISDSSSTSTTYLAAAPNPLPFYGLIYMPNTTATLGYDVRTGVQIYGAISAKKITFSSEATVHYDTSLRYAKISGVDQPYAITDWRELDGTERITLP